AVGHPTSALTTWKGWTDAVSATSPPLLVVICHTAKRVRAGTPAVQFEIGRSTGAKRQWLDVDEIASDYVIGPKGKPNPLVLLIGCSTAIPRVRFSNAVAQLMNNEAAIVLSTLSTILGEQAALTTAALIERLADMPPRRETTFGDALLKVRREMVADDVLMALALVAFGDADWRLARAP
ncbi:MAG: hypothetical protein M3406_04200, partial [Chloroflexota bacterium]|nr:hypothetical protein [Chloroflexota bacterium]